MEKAGPDIWPGLNASEFSAFLESVSSAIYQITRAELGARQ